MRSLLRRLIFAVCFLVLAALVAGGWYICTRGFTRHWRLRVTQEFRARGVDVYVHRLTLDPIEGLVARDVTIQDTVHRDRTLATIDRVALDINLTNLLHDKPFLDAVDLRNANLSLPVDESDAADTRLQVAHLNARIIFPPHQWYVSQAEASLYGIQISARGRLQNPEAFQPGENGSKRNAPAHPDLAASIVRTLKSLRFAGPPPRIEINFGGDLEDPSSLYADATLHAERIHRSSYELLSADAVLGLRDRVLELKQCNLGDVSGKLNASGSYDFATHLARLQLRSRLDAAGLARMLGASNLLADCKFVAPPLIEFSAQATPGKPLWSGLVTGHVALGRFRARRIAFQNAAADFSWDGTRWYIRNGTLANDTGSLAVQALSVPGSFRGRIDSTINPNSLRPLLDGPAADAMRDWDFEQSPAVSLTVTGTAASPDACTAQGQVRLGRTRMRGVPLLSASSQVETRGGTFIYRDFNIAREEGTATGSFSYDFDKHEAWLTNVHAHLNTLDAALWIDPGLPQNLAPYRFKSPPDVTLNGFVQCANDKGTHLDVAVDAPGGMDYTFCGRTLSFPKIAGHLEFLDHRLRILDVNAAFYRGTLGGGADISLAHDAPGYTAQLQVDDADFASLTKLFFDYQSSRGLVSGTFGFGGKNDDPRTLYGKGGVTVTQGNVFAIPVLGPFSGILNSIVPGMGYNVAHDASCDFAVKEGAVNTHDFEVKGKGFSMFGDGRLLFLDDKMDFRIRLNAQGLPGVLLFPVSKLLEYGSEGTLAKPDWKPLLLTRRETAAAAAAVVATPSATPPRIVDPHR